MREMKNSGVAWIGDIPSEWELKKGKFLFAQRNEKGNTIELQLLSPTQKYGVIPQSLYEELSGMKAVKLSEDANLTDFKSIYTGDFCISLRSFQGGFEYALYNGVVSPAYQVFYKITKNTFDGFYKYMFKEQGFIAYMTSFTKTFRDGKSISFSDFANSLLPLPPFAEQKRIAEFLDNQCAEIDTVIEKTKATIEEYKKLKQSVITQAVTKGIRPNRPMKDSGIEWIGEIPADWDLRAIKTSFSVYAGATPKSEVPEFWDGDIRWITPADYKTEDKFVESGRRRITLQGYNSCGTNLVPAGSIVFSKRAPIGSVAICNTELCTNQGCLSCVPKHRLNIDFFYFILSVLTEIFNLFGSGTTFKEISYDSFVNFRLPYPTLEEQNEIADYLDKKCSEIDELIAKKTSLLSELESYKKSLIYEYVTGKKEVTQ